MSHSSWCVHKHGLGARVPLVGGGGQGLELKARSRGPQNAPSGGGLQRWLLQRVGVEGSESQPQLSLCKKCWKAPEQMGRLRHGAFE